MRYEIGWDNTMASVVAQPPKTSRPKGFLVGCKIKDHPVYKGVSRGIIWRWCDKSDVIWMDGQAGCELLEKCKNCKFNFDDIRKLTREKFMSLTCSKCDKFLDCSLDGFPHLYFSIDVDIDEKLYLVLKLEDLCKTVIK